MSKFSTPLRRLPVLIPPVKNETLDSYITRLATANHLAAEDLDESLAIANYKGSPRYQPVNRRKLIDLERLSFLTGYSGSRLLETLPEIGRTLAPGQPVRHACPRCVSRHFGTRVKIFMPEHKHVCVTHSFWFGSLGPADNAYPDPSGPVDVSQLPIIRTAQRRHNRLVRRYGREAAGHAASTAREIWDRVNRFEFFGHVEWARLQIVRPGARQVSSTDPLVQAIRYPEIITVAGVLASPLWQQVACDRLTRQQAFDEVGRRLGRADYDWHPPKRHPLTYWAEGVEEQRRRGARADQR